MPSLIDIRRRIRSVKNTQQITKAMKVVSAAKLRRAQERVLAARPYAQIMGRCWPTLRSCGRKHRMAKPRLCWPGRPEETDSVRGDHSDRGLAGAFNSNVIQGRTAIHRGSLRTPSSNSSCWAVRGAIFSAGGTHCHGRTRPHFSRRRVMKTRRHRPQGDRAIRKGEIDAVYLVVNDFKTHDVVRLVDARPACAIARKEEPIGLHF